MGNPKTQSTPPPAFLRAILQDTAVSIRNTVAARLPGERPAWVVLPLSGSFPARRAKRQLLAFPPDLGSAEMSLEQFSARVSGLIRSDWLEGIVFRFSGLNVNLATAFALRQQFALLQAAGKRVLVLATQLDTASYYLASAADEIVMPESAELNVNGLALEVTFLRDALARLGISFEKLAIGEFKNAADQFVRQEMSDAQRRQYSELLDSYEETLLTAIASGRNTTNESVQGWVEAGVTSAHAAQALGMVDRVLYEDELLGDSHRTWPAAARFIPMQRHSSPGRVAVITLSGTITPGKSTRFPLPLPLFGSATAGAETLQQSFRLAEADARTAAIVFLIDSGGGSALASDLIHREVERLGSKKPVVAVLAGVAASGGYYVAAPAQRIIAAPVTLTGSIGVLAGKMVFEDFNARFGLNPEVLQRGRFASLYGSRLGFTPAERELVERSINDVYERFVARVAAGRKLSFEQVDALGRGRIWSGTAAVEHGLVDETGDLELGLKRARELAGLPVDAPVWNVTPASRYHLPPARDPAALVQALLPLRRERTLLLLPGLLRVRAGCC